MNTPFYRVIGLMSGTSLDGLDIAYCEFGQTHGQWQFSMPVAETIDYPEALRHKLSEAEHLPALQYVLLNVELGRFFGQQVRHFAQRHGLQPDFVSSHGHTIFHQPQLGLTTQIGSGADIAAQSGLPVVCDFRTLDVAMGGQGAPLVPVGDRLLFGQYAFRLNLGGIANISLDQGERSLAFDVAPCNMLLNHYMRTIGQEYDPDGALAASGKVDDRLLRQLNELGFYTLQGPKSLGKEWVWEEVLPLFERSGLSLPDKLTTSIEHTAYQIGRSLQAMGAKGGEQLLLTGGGAFNKHLVGRIAHYAQPVQTVVPDAHTISFKEALIFAFLGVLRLREEPNALRSVTGASADNSGGCLYLGGRRGFSPSEQSDWETFEQQGKGDFRRLLGC